MNVDSHRNAVVADYQGDFLAMVCCKKGSRPTHFGRAPLFGKRVRPFDAKHGRGDAPQSCLSPKNVKLLPTARIGVCGSAPRTLAASSPQSTRKDEMTSRSLSTTHSTSPPRNRTPLPNTPSTNSAASGRQMSWCESHCGLIMYGLKLPRTRLLHSSSVIVTNVSPSSNRGLLPPNYCSIGAEGECVKSYVNV